MLVIKVCENELFDVVLCCFKCFCEKAGVLVEVCCCEFYEKLIIECKCVKVFVVKCYVKKLVCENVCCICLY